MKTNNGSAVDIRQRKAKEMILEQLRRMPIIQIAAEKAGVGRATYYRLRAEDPAFAGAADQAIEGGQEFISDMSESQLIGLIRERNFAAISLWLKAHHPKYRAKVEISARAAQVEEELSPEQEDAVRQVLEAATLAKEEGRKRIET